MPPPEFPRLQYERPWDRPWAAGPHRGPREGASRDGEPGPEHQPASPRVEGDATDPTVAKPPASAPSILLRPLVTVVNDDVGLDTTTLITNADPDAHEPPTNPTRQGQRQTYNINREAFEFLLSTHADSFIATSSEEGLAISPSTDYRYHPHGSYRHRWHRHHHRHGHHLRTLQDAPIVVPVMCVLLLWIFATWYGRRRTERRERRGRRRFVESEKDAEGQRGA